MFYETDDLMGTLEKLIPVHNNIMISGAPGIGKSEITYQVCEKLGLKLYEVRLYEQGEFAAGLAQYSVSEKTGHKVLDFVMPWWFDDIREGGYDVLFLDDFHLVPLEIQKFLYRLLTDRHLHNQKLEKDMKIIMAGNFNIDSASASMVQSPIMGRIEIALNFVPNSKTFIKWALNNQDRIDKRVIAFIQAHPEHFYEDDPAPTTKYPSPRTYEHLSRNIKHFNSPDYAIGIIGEKAGGLFQELWPMLNLTVDQILNRDPKNVSIDELVPMITLLASEFRKEVSYRNNSTDNKIIKWIAKVPNEYKVLFVSNVKDRIGDGFILEMIKDNNKDMREIGETFVQIVKEIKKDVE